MSDNNLDLQTVVVEILKQLEPYFEELEKRLSKLEELLEDKKGK